MDKETFRKSYPHTTFRLGITMAGAVSAGAYSAGVMCQLLQTLTKWEKLKNANYDKLYDAAVTLKGSADLDARWIAEQASAIETKARIDKDVPMHDVIIEVIGGASAGSLVAALSFLSLGYEQIQINPSDLLDKTKANDENICPVKHAEDQQTLMLHKNLLFDTWVNLNAGEDPEKKKQPDALQSLLSINRDNELRKPFALLNAELFEKVEQYQLRRLMGSYSNPDLKVQDYKKQDIPSFISPNLNMFFSFTSLRGMSIGLAFSDQRNEKEATRPAHMMRMHACMAIFVRGDKRTSEYELNPYRKDLARVLIDAAIASGAFPIGLPPRNIILSTDYVKKYIDRTLGGDSSNLIDVRLGPDIVFDLAAVDGGTLNNEPFTEVFEHLQSQTARHNNEETALILIDPFPNFESEPDNLYKHPRSLLDIARGILGAIRGQAMVKDTRKMEALAMRKNRHIGMIFPSRRNTTGVRYDQALATSSLEGFAGFLSRDFRLHDFHLGMKNCQSFLRQYFFVDETKKDDYVSFRNWMNGDPCYRTYALNKDGVVRYPIIPDMDLRGHRDSADDEILKDGIGIAQFPSLEDKDILKYRWKIFFRLGFLVSRILTSKVRSRVAHKWNPLTAQWPFYAAIAISAIALCFTICLLFCYLPAKIFWLFVLALLACFGFSCLTFLLFATSRILGAIGDGLSSSKQLKQIKRTG